ncbi:MAG: hypothetical protein AABX98_05065, partial [Nanoarchaeota archaeon]
RDAHDNIINPYHVALMIAHDKVDARDIFSQRSYLFGIRTCSLDERLVGMQGVYIKPQVVVLPSVLASYQRKMNER